MKKKIIAFVLFVIVTAAPVYAAEIHQAVMAGDLARVRVLLDKNPHLINMPEDGITPVLYAAYQENRKMVDFLLARGAENTIFVAAIIGDFSSVKGFLDSNPGLAHGKDKNGQTPLHWAANKGHIRIVSLLVSRGAKVNIKDNTGWTPLEYAEEMKRKDVASYLRRHGAQ